MIEFIPEDGEPIDLSKFSWSLTDPKYSDEAREKLGGLQDASFTLDGILSERVARISDTGYFAKSRPTSYYERFRRYQNRVDEMRHLEVLMLAMGRMSRMNFFQQLDPNTRIQIALFHSYNRACMN